MDAEKQNCAGYDEPRFRSVLRQVRCLTRDPMPDAVQEARRLCSEAGVALAVVDPLPKVRLSGAAWWYRRGKPVIALTGRHRSDDHLWFSFFHEAAHLLLHSRREIFIDDLSPDGDDVEAQANVWAANFLLPRQHWRRFVASGVFGSSDVQEFAQDQGIAPGIVVGRLQHEGLIPWNHLNHLKKKAA